MCPAGSPIPEPPPSALLESNLAAVRERVRNACVASGRAPDDVRLVAVTKRVDAEVAADLARLGQVDLGESRPRELEEKADHLAHRGTAARWHLLGHLQRNKARRAVRHAHAIHSVDSVRLLTTLERVAAEEGRRPRVYLEVKLVPLEGRTGLSPEDVRGAVECAAGLEHLVPAGLMTMAPAPRASARPGAGEPLAAQAEAAQVFRALRRLRDDLGPELASAFEGGRIELSMGMSADLEAAVAEGADVVRVGTALFAGLDTEAGPTP